MSSGARTGRSWKSLTVRRQGMTEVARMGDPAPPMFWMRDPSGHTLMVVQQP
jgi:hypothetical protein